MVLGPAFQLACSSSSKTPRFDTVSSFADEPRRPPGLAVDPAAELPRPAASGASEQGLLVLREPVDDEAAKETVRRFFRAVVSERSDELLSVIDESATVQTGAQGTRQSARSFWQMRLTRLDYGALAALAVYRETALETYRAKDAARLRPTRALPLAVSGDEVLIRAPIAQSHAGKTRLFGDEILFVLRPQNDAFRIASMLEDFALP